ncbi:endolytic transglycosylase MltG [Stakelama saccharophila]|uniref:Endolytic murein transglycosylase n=1 Tax=Stakelama saccharophila TaxID=3075605 RepID=A0ABZ0B7X4_9SPHN|nr:endolytic transglycosylase MltG [Stakelama sp. W311]WNO52449.1 endolytic transglycosylase MltG [Stakelama sp. W311]
MRKLGCFGIVIALTAVAALFFVVQSWNGAGPAPKAVTVVVPRGATLTDAAERLEDAGAIPSARRFLLLAKVFGSGEPIRAGEYLLPARASQSKILGMMESGDTLQRFVTIPEGLPSIMVYETLMATPELSGKVAVPEEGTVLPDSYSYQRGDTRAAILARMQRAMRDYLARAWAKRAADIAVETPREALILASIVEKETAKPQERRMVAAVYSNRLEKGMLLQADPTVIYPITRGKPLGRRIRQSELTAKNGYNTYAEAGLPAGPIANPGRASIDAVLHPAQSDALYFVADGTGGHVFSDTLEEHNANVRKWYAIRRKRGEM